MICSCGSLFRLRKFVLRDQCQILRIDAYFHFASLFHRNLLTLHMLSTILEDGLRQDHREHYLDSTSITTMRRPYHSSQGEGPKVQSMITEVLQNCKGSYQHKLIYDLEFQKVIVPSK